MSIVEERQAERVRSFLRARIIFNNGNSTIDCIVKNFSATGAKIDVSSTLSIPDMFDLEVPQKGRTFRARLRWRITDAIGVEFVTVESRAPVAPAPKLEQLEAENRRLKRKVAQLSKRLENLGQDPSEESW